MVHQVQKIHIFQVRKYLFILCFVFDREEGFLVELEHRQGEDGKQVERVVSDESVHQLVDLRDRHEPDEPTDHPVTRNVYWVDLEGAEVDV